MRPSSSCGVCLACPSSDNRAFCACSTQNPETCCQGYNCYPGVGQPDYCVSSGRSGLSGSTLVHTLESATPLPLAQVKVGDHIPCGGSMKDLDLAQTTRWCEVMNILVRPQSRDMFNITITKPGASGDTTMLMHGRQLLYQLDNKGVAVQDQSPPAVTTPNMYKPVRASAVKVGDKVLVKSRPADLAAGPVLGTVAKVAKAHAPTAYKPMVDAPFMVLGGVVLATYDAPSAPREAGWKASKPSDETMRSATLAQAQLMAPFYTQHLQPVGTPAEKAAGSAKFSLMPLWDDIASHISTLVDTKNTKGLEEIHGWFAPRYANHVARKGGVSVDDTREIIQATSHQAAHTEADLPPKPDEASEAESESDC